MITLVIIKYCASLYYKLDSMRFYILILSHFILTKNKVGLDIIFEKKKTKIQKLSNLPMVMDQLPKTKWA